MSNSVSTVGKRHSVAISNFSRHLNEFAEKRRLSTIQYQDPPPKQQPNLQQDQSGGFDLRPARVYSSPGYRNTAVPIT